MTKQEAKRIANNIIDLRSSLLELDVPDYAKLKGLFFINSLNELQDKVYELNAETEA